MPKEIYSTSPDSSYKNFCHEKYKFDLEIHRSGVIWIFKNRDFSVQIIYKTHTHTHPTKCLGGAVIFLGWHALV